MSTPAPLIVAVVSDIHFDLHHELAWRTFRRWHAQVRPHFTVVLGDFVDFGMLSKYPQGPDAPVHAVPQIRCFVREANALAAECGRLIVVEGNHDERWYKAVIGALGAAVRGAEGLTLREQCLRHGLAKNTEWRIEANGAPPLRVGQFVLRHGHHQARGFVTAKNIATGRLARSLGQSEIVAHHHVAQMACATAHDHTATVICNPCLAASQDYCVDPNWQLGWTVLQLDPERDHAHAQILLVQDGRVAWGGRIYDGNGSADKPLPEAATIVSVGKRARAPAADDRAEHKRALRRKRDQKYRDNKRKRAAAPKPPRAPESITARKR